MIYGGLSMQPRGITREMIEALNESEPNCFETDREEQWFNVGLINGLNAADVNPKSPWISVKDDLPCNHKEMIKVDIENADTYTDRVLAMTSEGMVTIAYMYKIDSWLWHWSETDRITHWMPIPKLEEE